MAKSKYQIELEQFKQKVVDTVLEFQPEYSLCDEGVNSFFDVMGLSELAGTSEKEFTVTLKVSGDRSLDESTIQDWISDYKSNIRHYTESGNSLTVEAKVSAS